MVQSRYEIEGEIQTTFFFFLKGMQWCIGTGPDAGAEVPPVVSTWWSVLLRGAFRATPRLRLETCVHIHTRVCLCTLWEQKSEITDVSSKVIVTH